MPEQKKTSNGKVVEATSEEIQRRRQLLQQKKRKRLQRQRAVILVIIFAVLGLIAGKIVYDRTHSPDSGQIAGNQDTPATKEPDENAQKEARRAEMMKQAETIAAGYDYDKAVELLKTIENYENDTKVSDLISSYETMKGSLVE